MLVVDLLYVVGEAVLAVEAEVAGEEDLTAEEAFLVTVDAVLLVVLPAALLVMADAEDAALRDMAEDADWLRDAADDAPALRLTALPDEVPRLTEEPLAAPVLSRLPCPVVLYLGVQAMLLT